MFSSIDGIEAIISLVDDVVSYLDSSTNSDIVGLSLVGKALKYALASGKIQLSKIRSAINNTKSKKIVEQDHNKLIKADRRCHASFGHTRGVQFSRSQINTIFSFRRTLFSKFGKHEFGL